RSCFWRYVRARDGVAEFPRGESSQGLCRTDRARRPLPSKHSRSRDEGAAARGLKPPETRGAYLQRRSSPPPRDAPCSCQDAPTRKAKRRVSADTTGVKF